MIVARFILCVVAILAPTMAASRGSVLHSGGAWAALDRGSVCEAQTRSLNPAARNRARAIAGFAFSADRRRWGEFHVRLGRPLRPESSVILTVGSQPFLLVARGDWAWSRGTRQQTAILDAVRGASGMRVEAREPSGRRFTDRYLLDGAPTAIDAAAARCASKMLRR